MKANYEPSPPLKINLKYIYQLFERKEQIFLFPFFYFVKEVMNIEGNLVKYSARSNGFKCF